MTQEALQALAEHVRRKAKRLSREADEVAKFAGQLEDALAATTLEEATAHVDRHEEEARSPAHA